MDSENWNQLQALFHLAETTPAEQREKVLEAACPDPELRRRTLEILRAAEVAEAESELATPPQPANEAGHTMGPYRLIRLVGSGGIGAVYLAERMAGGAIQRSALKVLAPHAAGPTFVERFQREQHILASLDHPNITRMLDAGIGDAGQPYLVMEFIDGVPLDTYCDERKLSVEARLELFLKVCDAVAYAHRNLVVHLDLKPSNTLVTADGQVKLLDFGTSKLIDLDGRFTSTLMATPAYASPEQLRNEPVTTSCDVYSLGAMLFELLAGRRPEHHSSVSAMIERAVLEREPESLLSALTPEAAQFRGLTEARLRQRLQGDLATIVGKCLRPRPKDRYISVIALVNDLRRHLDGLPVLARPQTFDYRAAKFLRRHRAATAIAAIMFLALAATLGYATWREEQALREGQRALVMQTFLYRLFQLANSEHTGKPAATVPEFLALGVKVLPQYIPNPADLRMAQLGLAESMYNNGDLDSADRTFRDVIASAKASGDLAAQAEAETFSGDIAFQNGQLDEGKALTAHALQLAQSNKVPPSVKVWSEIHYAQNLDNNGFRSDQNLVLLRDAVKIARENHLSGEETAFALTILGDDLTVRGLQDEAEANYTQALNLYNQDPTAICEQSGAYGDIGFIHQRKGDPATALDMYRKAFDGYAQCSGPDSRNALTELDYVGSALIDLNRSPEAVAVLEPAVLKWRKLIGENPDLTEPLFYLSDAYVKTGQFEKAAALAKEQVDIQTGKVAPTDRRFGKCHFIWAQALAGQKHYNEALPHARIAADLLNRNSVSAFGKKAGAEATALLQDIESKLTHP